MMERPLRAGAMLTVWMIALTCLHGCTDLSRSSVDALRFAVHRQPHVRPTAAEVFAKPYYQMQATSPDGSAVLILGNVDGPREAWYGSHQVVVFIEHGRIVQTSGLKQNLDHMQLPADDPFARGLQTIKTPTDYKLIEDWSPGYRYGVRVDARLVPMGMEEVDILGTTHHLLRIDEELSSTSVRLRRTNHYWVEPHDGFVWQSEQQVAPGLGLKLVQLRPYQGKQP